ncbi:MAG TPA: mandelate racemase/muconate lactonizing enzyme family protein [Streptosporangiaceae bacterium]|nr:mandelate racemase/muconate lactonizing enzyme family protein [Streptosporangiaceae bacterium]
MKITNVEPLVLGTAWRNLTFVVVQTDAGIEGLGEVRMVNHTDALLGFLREAVPRHVLGSDPFEIESLVRRMTTADYARPGEVAMSAASVIEIACWDIMGKALGQPVYRLLGGAVRDRIKAYANGWYQVDRTAAEFHAAARRAIDRGYQAVKVDPFGDANGTLSAAERGLSISLIEAVRDAIGADAELMIEMHGRFTPRTALSLAADLARFSPSWIEEPIPPDDLKALAWVAGRVSVPVATGERIHVRSEFRELFERRGADIVQPDITMCGGLSETKKIASWAESYSILVAPHNVGGPVSTAAALHLAACTPNFYIQENFNDFAEDYVMAAAPGNPLVADGYFALPAGPGLGVTLDRDVIASHPRRPLFFDLYSEGWQMRQAGLEARPDAGGDEQNAS